MLPRWLDDGDNDDDDDDDDDDDSQLRHGCGMGPRLNRTLIILIEISPRRPERSGKYYKNHRDLKHALAPEAHGPFPPAAPSEAEPSTHAPTVPGPGAAEVAAAEMREYHRSSKDGGRFLFKMALSPWRR